MSFGGWLRRNIKPGAHAGRLADLLRMAITVKCPVCGAEHRSTGQQHTCGVCGHKWVVSRRESQ